MSKFDITAEEAAKLRRLQSNTDFQSLVKYLERRLDGHKERLVVADANLVPPVQGRARELADLIEVFTKGTS